MDTNPPAQIDDRELVARARAGDGDAVRALWDRYHKPLIRFCYRYLGAAEDAEDAAQEVFANIAAKGHWPEGPFRPWLYRLARNDCFRRMKRRADGTIALDTFLGSELRWPHTGPGTAVAKRERDERARRVLASLPVKIAELLTMRYFDRMKVKEIAEVLELSEFTVKSRLATARAELARRYQEARHWTGEGSAPSPPPTEEGDSEIGLDES